MRKIIIIKKDYNNSQVLSIIQDINNNIKLLEDSIDHQKTSYLSFIIINNLNKFNQEIINIINNYKTNNDIDKNYNYPLYYAVSSGNVDITNALIKKNYKNLKTSSNLLKVAIIKNKKEIVKTLLDNLSFDCKEIIEAVSSGFSTKSDASLKILINFIIKTGVRYQAVDLLRDEKEIKNINKLIYFMIKNKYDFYFDDLNIILNQKYINIAINNCIKFDNYNLLKKLISKNEFNLNYSDGQHIIKKLFLYPKNNNILINLITDGFVDKHTLNISVDKFSKGILEKTQENLFNLLINHKRIETIEKLINEEIIDGKHHIIQHKELFLKIFPNDMNRIMSLCEKKYLEEHILEKAVGASDRRIKI